MDVYTNLLFYMIKSDRDGIVSTCLCSIWICLIQILYDSVLFSLILIVWFWFYMIQILSDSDSVWFLLSLVLTLTDSVFRLIDLTTRHRDETEMETERLRTSQMQAERTLESRERAHRQRVKGLEEQVSPETESLKFFMEISREFNRKP